jgi:hypothetical protein
MIADHPDLAHMVADAFYLIQKTHALGEVISQAPEVDHIPAFAGKGCAFNDYSLPTCCVQPERRRRPRNARAGYERCLLRHDLS